MKSIVTKNTVKFSFNPAHKGAPYTIDGIHYMNNGELMELVAKSVLGYNAKKDVNTPFDKGSDIEEINASVKSSRATVANVVLGETLETSIDVFFERVHSTTFIYATMIENDVVLYFMNADEFKEFLTSWCKLNERGYMRLKATSGKMIKWFEERVA